MLYLDEIDAHVFRAVSDARRAEGVRESTCNRTMQALRDVLRICEEWDSIHRAPKVRILKEGVGRILWSTREEADGLLAELPEHVSDMVRVTPATGLREANVTGLDWRGPAAAMSEPAGICVNRCAGVHTWRPIYRSTPSYSTAPSKSAVSERRRLL